MSGVTVGEKDNGPRYNADMQRRRSGYHSGVMTGAFKDWDERIGQRLTLRDLSILLTAVDAGSMSKAAELLRVSQPAISRTISLLEREVGAQLITRTSRGIKPTEHGDALVTRSRAALDQLRDAVDEMDVLADAKVGKLRLAANEVALSGVVGTVINRLYERYPGIVFEIVPAHTHTAQIQELERGTVELVIGQVAPSDVDRHFEVTQLFQEPLVVVAGARNAWTRRSKIELAELMDEPWAFSPLNSVSGRSMEQAFRARGLDLPRIMAVSSSMQVLRRLVMDNEFLAFFPRSAAQGVHVLPVLVQARWQPIGILSVRHRTLSPLAELFIECARDVVRESEGGSTTHRATKAPKIR
jgi:DNA-binding transcriptional LysR family regulator